MAIDTSPGAVTPSKPPVLWLGAGVLALVSLATAAAIALRPSAPEPQMTPLPSAAGGTGASVAQAETVPAAPTAVPSEGAVPAAKPAARPAKPAAPHPAPAPVRVATVCTYCGVVESVLAVQHKGQGTGIGVVAGGVLGAAVGNQFGHSNGRAAMTVLGAVGGGLAGNEVEKRVRADTVFQVRVRLDDGSLRTLEQTVAPKVGTRVEVHGNSLKAAA
jgi:outer membrane lipoprotein SlyB